MCSSDLFPSHDKMLGNEREVLGERSGARNGNGKNNDYGVYGSADDGKFTETKGTSEWEGYGTALKPAHEPCVLARKPLSEKSVAPNVLKHGTGGLNIDGCRVGTEKLGGGTMPDLRDVGAMSKESTGIDKLSFGQNPRPATRKEQPTYEGRFPSNLILDGSDEVEAVFPVTNRVDNRTSCKSSTGMFFEDSKVLSRPQDNGGSASRYFYTAKASKSERNAGLEGFEDAERTDYGGFHSEKGLIENGRNPENRVPMKNGHPTVKPLSLTKYLATLIKPPTGGRLLVPFSGSGSEMIGALQAGWEYVEGVELTEEYIPIAEARIKYWTERVKEEDKQVRLV